MIVLRSLLLIFWVVVGVVGFMVVGFKLCIVVVVISGCKDKNKFSSVQIFLYFF